ncbi:DUF4124 domain-containing protein [Candidatus Thiodictyon syntrophicum]|jgi:hypothetical protein|uniref:DUF4124 domain-containing protein n=1 Tax=Candidatus Thiodictyon syntrophicum TaxID=1166950 RepID=A0A2K8U586_9GAMM|nr:DUF4124 domain-containing protein [Candidatus Thiodictyon syntrophicum]AUB80705.1 hypothetical protein THSYN_06890 [Candidatus Thiodictyon syntrophicum]
MNRCPLSPRASSSAPRPGCRGFIIAALVLAGAATALGAVAADAIYKSVDAQGRVSYSTTAPVPDSAGTVEAMRIRIGAEAPPPGGVGQGANAGAATLPSPQQAQQALIQAKAALEQAKIHGEDDWQTTPGGQQVSTLEYDQRVTAAQEKVRELEAALGRARKR